MADLRILGSTSNVVRFSLKHSTTGQGLTGLSSASTGLIISTIADNESSATVYTVAGSTIESITTLGTFSIPTATKCRFKEIDATNHPGLYEFQFADARFSISSAKRLIISVSGATNLLGTDYEIQLTKFDVYSNPVVKKNTAFNKFPFLLVSTSDHVTGVTGATITAQRSLDGAAFGNCTNNGTYTEVGNGNYEIDLSAADLNGNVIILKFTASGADPRLIHILPAT